MNELPSAIVVSSLVEFITQFWLWLEKAKPQIVVTGIIMIIKSKKVNVNIHVCMLCQCKSDDPTPLVFVGTDPHEGTLPWAQYGVFKSLVGEIIRIPTAKLCGICWNIFRMGGFQDEREYL